MCVVVAIAFVGAMRFKNDTTYTKSTVINYSTDKPNESKPDKNNYKWKGVSTEPKYIDLPTIKSGGFIQNVGIDQNNKIAVPNNIHIAGWFKQSKLPGDKGLSILDGHVTGRVNNGIFKNLINVKDGDSFTVEFGDGTRKNFRTVKKIDVPENEAKNVLFSQEPSIVNQLNLITCSGEFNSQTRSYPNRLIVISELQQ